MKRRVLIVDDSPLIRSMLRDMISSDHELEIVGFAQDGNEAVQRVAELKPDVVTMDVEMPNKNGICAVREIMASNPTPILMVSSLTSAGTSSTVDALSAGAFDFICKPGNGSLRHFREVRDELIRKIHASSFARFSEMSRAIVQARTPMLPGNKIILIASSTGGPRSLSILWQQLPKDLNVPILLVQHMPPGFTASLASRLSSYNTVPCREANDGDSIEPGQALMAVGGRHMRVAPGDKITLEDGPSIHGVKPAADHLFTSASEIYGSRIIGAVLTGMGRDGAAGAKAILDSGGIVFGESESSCTIYGMPKAAKEFGGITAEYAIHEMGQAVVGALTRKVARAS
jgi:two-component system chemotaxis response regulator CheB